MKKVRFADKKITICFLTNDDLKHTSALLQDMNKYLAAFSLFLLHPISSMFGALRVPPSF